MKSSYLYRRDLGQAGQVFGIGDGGDELDGSDDGTRRAAEGVSASHAGAGGTGGVGVVEGGHREGACVTRVGVLHGEKRQPGVSEVRERDGRRKEEWTRREGNARESMARRGGGGAGGRGEGRTTSGCFLWYENNGMGCMTDACGCGGDACCTKTQMAERVKKKEGAKPLIVVSNETFGGSSQILSTSVHRERSAGCSGGLPQHGSQARSAKVTFGDNQQWVRM